MDLKAWKRSKKFSYPENIAELLVKKLHTICCEDNKRYFGLENSRFNFTVSLVLHFHLDSSDDSDNYLENLTACELQNKSNCQSKKWNLITPKPTRTIAWRVTQSVFCPPYFWLHTIFLFVTEAAIPPFKDQCIRWHNIYREKHQVNIDKPLTPQHQHPYSPNCSLKISLVLARRICLKITSS